MCPVVTVIVTVYDRTQFLAEALASVLKQTYRSYEVIVTDDSGSDAIKAICESFQSPQIRYRRNRATLGVALNLRAALGDARGRYVAILNDDDAWAPDFLAALVSPLEQSADRVIAFSDHWIVLADGTIDVDATDANSARYSRSDLPAGELLGLADLVLEKNAIPLAMGAVFRRDAVDAQLLVPEIAGAYDFWISCLLAALGKPAYYVPQRLTRYRIHRGMETTRKAPDKNENMEFIFKKLLEMDLFPAKRNLLRRRYGRALFQVGKDNMWFDRLPAARARFISSARAAPNWRALAALGISFLPKGLRRKCGLTE